MFESGSVQTAILSKKGKENIKRKVAFLVCVCLVFLGVLGNVFITPTQAAEGTNHVVISEIYGGGGNSYENDYIELYNPTSSSVSLSGWSVQYASSAGAFTSNTKLTGSIGAHQYYLIKEASGSGGTDLPTADDTGTIAMSATTGKVALAKVTTSVSGSKDSNVVDFVGYGSASDYETTPTKVLSATTSAERKDNNGGTAEGQGNGWDTDNNANDFVLQAA